MRRAAVPLPPEEIWLGEAWEEPAPRRRPRPLEAVEDPAPEPAPARAPARPTIAPPPTAAVTPRATAAPERRTVTIRGRGAERDLSWTAGPPRRRPQRPAHERPGFRPDRAALWAVVLGLLLVLVAATSSHAAVRAPHAAVARTLDGAAPAARTTPIRAVTSVRAQAVLRHRA
jgi:hypothetical protein